MKRKLFAILLAVAMVMTSFVIAIPAAAAEPTGKTVYVDSETGSDSNPGTDINAPRKTLEYLAYGANIQPGDTVLLKRGSVWNNRWSVPFSGTADAPILVSDYGDPNDPAPVINGGGPNGTGDCAIWLENKSYVTIENLTLTCYNPQDEDDWKTGYYRRSGIWVVASPGYGAMRGIVLRNLEVTKVTGISISENFPVGPNRDQSQSSNSAIHLNQWHWGDGTRSYFDGLTVENCYIHDNTVVGLGMDGYANGLAKNVVIRNNVINNVGADGLIIGAATNPIIEHNVAYNSGAYGTTDFYWIAAMWVWNCYGITMQYNEAAYTKGMDNVNQSDAVAFDTDIVSQGDHYYQYNYTHDNEGGFYFDMAQLTNGTNYVRYNISANDGRYNGARNTVATGDTTVFSNNVFYYDKPTIEGDHYNAGFRMSTSSGDRTQIINNVFYIPNGNGSIICTADTQPTISNNAFYGISAPEGAVFSIEGVDPGFVNAAYMGDGWTPGGTWDIRELNKGFKLKEDSPLIGAGKYIPLNASTANNGGKDFWGNPLYSGSPDIGAFEMPESTVGDITAPEKPTNLAASAIKDTSLTLTWESAEDGKALDAKIYNAADNSLIAYVMGTNTYTVTGLSPVTDYTFYVVAVDNSGNESEASDPVSARTVFGALILDNGNATKTGSWTTASGSSCYGNDYLIADGTSDATLRWNPNIPEDGYYEVYYWQPNGNSLKTRNATYTISFDGGTATYGVDQRQSGGTWVLLATHKFKAGTEGYIELSGGTEGELNGDAIRILYSGAADPTDIASISLSIGTTMLTAGQTTAAAIIGKSSDGLNFNLVPEGAEITYVIEDPSVISVENGVVTALADGSSRLQAMVEYNGETYTTNSVVISVGNGLVIGTPEFTNAAGDVVTELTSADPLTANLTIANMSIQTRQITVIAIAYNGNEMYSYNSQTAVVRSLNEASYNVGVTIPANWQDCDVELYIWDSIDGMRPISQPFAL